MTFPFKKIVFLLLFIFAHTISVYASSSSLNQVVNNCNNNGICEVNLGEAGSNCSVDCLASNQIAMPLNGGQVDVTSIKNQVVFFSATGPSTISVPSNVNNATLNFDYVVDNVAGIGILSNTTVYSSTSIGDVTIEIQANTSVNAGGSWNGIMNVPTVKSNSSVNLGSNNIISAVVEIGLDDTALIFDKAVRIKFLGYAGKKTGYSRNGVFTEISQNCSADNLTSGNVLPSGGDCKIDVGSDMIIWTKHFTSFVIFTPVPEAVLPTTVFSNGPYALPGQFKIANLEVSPVNVTGVSIVSDVDRILINWTNPKNKEFDLVRVVRSENFYSDTPFFGRIIYEGTESQFSDNDVKGGIKYYYTIFVKNKNGGYSSGAVTSVIFPSSKVSEKKEIKDVVPVKISVIPPMTYNLSIPKTPSITISDFIFIQGDKKIKIKEEVKKIATVEIVKGEILKIFLDYKKKEIFKDIIITIENKKDTTDRSSYLFKVNKKKTVYEVAIDKFANIGQYNINISFVDDQNKEIQSIMLDMDIKDSVVIQEKTEGFFKKIWNSAIGIIFKILRFFGK